MIVFMSWMLIVNIEGKVWDISVRVIHCFVISVGKSLMYL